MLLRPQQFIDNMIHGFAAQGVLSAKHILVLTFDTKMTGEWTWYRENGKLMQTGSFDNDTKTGVWTRYREDGTLMDKTVFINGKKGEIKKF